MKRNLLLCFLSLWASLAGAGAGGDLSADLLRAGQAQHDEKLTRKAVQCWLLEHHQRLLPERTAEGVLEALVAEMQGGAPALGKDALPPADELVLQGDFLTGGNFRFIDNLISLERRPIALDRMLPMLLVPLPADAVEEMEKKRQQFQASAPAGLINARVERFHMQPIARTFVEDGLAMRSYAGRADDWYFHLVQTGTPYQQLQFFAILESWRDRAYHPLTGLGSPQEVPPVWFSLSDILSHGSLAAVNASPASGRNPFRGFGSRVLPFCQGEFGRFEAGKTLIIPPVLLAQARASRLRLAPPVVPAMFNDPSRFIGWNERPHWIQVKGAPIRSAGPFSEPELPEQGGGQPLSLRDAAALGYWENPGQQPTPASAAGPAGATEAEPVPPAVPGRKQASRSEIAPVPVDAPPTAAAPAAPAAPPESEQDRTACCVVVLLPKIDEAEAYVQAMAANEGALAANSAALGRARSVHAWLAEAAALLPEAEAEVRLACEEAIIKGEAEIDKLNRERFDILCERSLTRRKLEHTLREERLPALVAGFANKRSL